MKGKPSTLTTRGNAERAAELKHQGWTVRSIAVYLSVPVEAVRAALQGRYEEQRKGRVKYYKKPKKARKKRIKKPGPQLLNRIARQDPYGLHQPTQTATPRRVERVTPVICAPRRDPKKDDPPPPRRCKLANAQPLGVFVNVATGEEAGIWSGRRLDDGRAVFAVKRRGFYEIEPIEYKILWV